MKFIYSTIMVASFLFSGLAHAELELFDTLTKIKQRPADAVISATILEMDGNIPKVIGFVQDRTIISIVSVSALEAPIDVVEGEVFKLSGNSIEGDICNFDGSLRLTGNGFSVTASKEQIRVLRNCSNIAALGFYIK